MESLFQKVGYDPKKVGKILVTLLISRTGVCVFFSEKGAVRSFFSKRG
jgi:hypothetical protein